MDVFPAPAGMNRVIFGAMHPASCVPRTRGDEPGDLIGRIAFVSCSPHPRG